MTEVLITGANRGIGLELARQYVARGNRVLAACRNPSRAARLRELEGDCLRIVELDVSSKESIHAFSRDPRLGSVALFINNAGVYGPPGAEFGQVDGEAWMDVLRVNTIGPLLLTQALLPAMASGGKLVYISSKMGSIEENTGGGTYIYRSSKAALNQVVKSLSIDLKGKGFTVAALHPGWVRTDMGGPNALIDVETSARGLIEVIDGLTAKDTGGFFSYDGSLIPW